MCGVDASIHEEEGMPSSYKVLLRVDHDCIQAFTPGEKSDTADAGKHIAHADDIVGCRCGLYRQFVNAGEKTDQAQTHQKQTSATHSTAHHCVVLPVYLFFCCPQSPSGAGGKDPGDPASNSRHLDIPYAGEGAINAHRNQKHQRYDRQTDQIEPLQKADLLRRLHKTKPGADIDPHCFWSFMTGAINVLDLIIFCKFPIAQDFCSNRIFQ